MEKILAFIANHPELSAAFLWPLVSSIFTAILKRKTPEAYNKLANKYPTWFFSRLAALIQLIGALGLDPIKATKALKKVVSGKTESR